MDLTSILNYILIIAALQGIAFNIFTIHISRRKVTTAVIYLNLTVLALSLNILQAWFFSDHQPDNFILRNILFSWDLLILPFFHAFLVYYLRIEASIRIYVRLSLFIFLFLLASRMITIAISKQFWPGNANEMLLQYTNLEEIFIAGFSLFIFIKCYQLLFTKQHSYTYIQKFDDISWLRRMWKVGICMFLLWIIAISLFNLTGNVTGYQVLRLGLSGVIYWIGYQGFFRYHKANDRISIRKSISANKAIQIEKSRSITDTESKNELSLKHQADFEKIDRYLIEKQRFLDPNLGLEDLAEEMEMSSTHLSKIINNQSEYNFSDYINSLRIEQAKKLLKDKEFCKYTIVAIGLECGFNSRSTFYSAFKKFTSQTPSKYRDVC
ncbi:AraC-like DNA-binding protein [Christiangramia gaetbulicola]|uniref:AraC-like DNA-binding protein n=1 Tax=Christiangramia gaetbulicola TaxID=703340 RepID=A0A2T6AGN1_9FLAO|nr:helix-turn-helix transcriptional regulator [Christiangramia gaetbulicola]PTX42983.1 AraC-like DNA-binding protein [Christiangramia gaetbulicola]